MSKKRIRLTRLLALLAALTLFAAACSSDDTTDGAVDTDQTTAAPSDTTDDGGSDTTAAAATTAAPSDGPTIIRVGKVEPTFIDSYNIQDSEGFAVGRLLYDGLTDFDTDLNAVPAVAESWDTDDFVTWTFNLRPGTTFHDGEAVTAQSFVDAFNYLGSPDAASDVSYYGLVADIEGFGDVLGGDATEITGLTAVDDNTLEIVLNGPNPLLPKILGHPAFSPRPSSALADPAGNNETPNGNGPYMMNGAWEHNVLISLVPFDGYYGDPGIPGQVDFQLFDSIDTMFLEVQAGNLDVADVPPEQIDAAKAEFGDRFLEVATGGYNYLGLPNNLPPFDNPDLRASLSKAIDRPTITQEIFAGTRDPADGFYPPLSPGGTPGICTNCTFDPEGAVALYEQSGGIPGNEVIVSFNSGGGHEDWTQAVCNNWLQVLGITCTFESEEFAPYLDKVQNNEIPGPFRLGWGWDYPHAEGFLGPLLKSDSGDNLTQYNNAEYDALLAEFRTLSDPESPEAVALIAQASEILNNEMPLIPVYFSRGQRVLSDCVDPADAFLNAFDFVELENITPQC